MSSQLDTIEKMLQVTLEAICALAKETTGKSLVIGHFDADGNGFGATPLSTSIKWVRAETDQSDVPPVFAPTPADVVA